MAGPGWAQKSDRSSHVQVAILAEQLCRERPGREVRAGIEVVEGLRRGCRREFAPSTVTSAPPMPTPI